MNIFVNIKVEILVLKNGHNIPAPPSTQKKNLPLTIESRMLTTFDVQHVYLASLLGATPKPHTTPI
jgi:hypothetical protein